jgi:hypothetical protein
MLQVLRIEDYGALLSIYNSSGKPSGVQGLLHKSELSWDLVMTVDDVVKAGGCCGSSSWGLGCGRVLCGDGIVETQGLASKAQVVM